jgi:hypothetical protein
VSEKHNDEENEMQVMSKPPNLHGSCFAGSTMMICWRTPKNGRALTISSNGKRLPVLHFYTTLGALKRTFSLVISVRPNCDPF